MTSGAAALCLLLVPALLAFRACALPDPSKVQLSMYVMSRCPDAVYTEQYLQQVLAATQDIAEAQFHYIASVQDTSVTCMHGPLECAGNRQQLCFQAYNTANATYRFVSCMDSSPPAIGTLALFEQCLQEAANPTAQQVRHCGSGSEGDLLLLNDARNTAALGVRRSATVFLDGSIHCIRDGGAWYDCPQGSDVVDFIASICEAYWARTGSWPEDICGGDKAATSALHGVQGGATAAA